MAEEDPHPNKTRFVGRECTFDGPAGDRWSGLILEQTFIGFTVRGHLPNYRLKIQGRTGKIADVDLVEQHISLKP